MKYVLRTALSLAAGFAAFLVAMYLGLMAIGIILPQKEDNLGLSLIVGILGFPVWLLAGVAAAVATFLKSKGLSVPRISFHSLFWHN
jgi:hypothetical protein